MSNYRIFRDLTGKKIEVKDLKSERINGGAEIKTTFEITSLHAKVEAVCFEPGTDRLYFNVDVGPSRGFRMVNIDTHKERDHGEFFVKVFTIRIGEYRNAGTDLVAIIASYIRRAPYTFKKVDAAENLQPGHQVETCPIQWGTEDDLNGVRVVFKSSAR